MRHLGRQHSNAILFALILVIGMTAFVCAEAAAVDPPGAKVSPLSPSRMSLFRDDEIFLSEIYYQDSKSLYATISPNSSTMTSDTWPVVTGNSSMDNFFPLNNPGHRPAAASAGRFLDPASEVGPYRQSVVYALYNQSNMLYVYLFDKNTRLPGYYLFDPLANVPLPASLDVKAWDVDRFADAQGRLHDEIIVASTAGGDGTYVACDRAAICQLNVNKEIRQ